MKYNLTANLLTEGCHEVQQVEPNLQPLADEQLQFEKGSLNTNDEPISLNGVWGGRW